MKRIYVNGVDLTGADKKVLLTTDQELSVEDAIEIKKALADHFPGTNFVLLSGFTTTVVPNTPSYDFEVEDDDNDE